MLHLLKYATVFTLLWRFSPIPNDCLVVGLIVAILISICRRIGRACHHCKHMGANAKNTLPCGKLKDEFKYHWTCCKCKKHWVKTWWPDVGG